MEGSFRSRHITTALLEKRSGGWSGPATALGIPFKHPSAIANAALDIGFELRQSVGYTGYPAALSLKQQSSSYLTDPAFISHFSTAVHEFSHT